MPKKDFVSLQTRVSKRNMNYLRVQSAMRGISNIAMLDEIFEFYMKSHPLPFPDVGVSEKEV